MLEKHDTLKKTFLDPIRWFNTTQKYKKYKDVFGKVLHFTQE